MSLISNKLIVEDAKEKIGCDYKTSSGSWKDKFSDQKNLVFIRKF